MAGILGDLFGLGGGTQAPTPGLLDAAGYMDPAQYDRMRQSQSMMGLWAGLLAGGGPSLSPRNFGSALGAGLTGAQQFGSQFDESQLHSAQAAQARANVGKLAAETGQLGTIGKLQEALISGKVPMYGQGAGSGGATAPGSGSSTPNFGAGSGGGGGWGPHAATAIETLKGAGYSDAAIQGVMANGLGEGGFSAPWVKAGGGENSFGHWQFNAGGELPGYMAFVRAQGGDPQDTRLQALYVAKRAEEVSPGFSKLDDPKLATDIFATKFERYKGAAPGQRYGLLTDAQRYMAGQPVETREAIPAGPGGYAPEGAPTGGIPAFTAGRAAAFGGPAPAPAIMTAPGANPNASGPVNVRPLAGEAAPAGTPVAEAAIPPPVATAPIPPPPAAAAAPVLLPGGRAPIPAAAVAPAQPVPAPVPQGALPPAAAPAPAGTQPSAVPAGPMGALPQILQQVYGGGVNMPQMPAVPMGAAPAVPPLPAVPGGGAVTGPGGQQLNPQYIGLNQALALGYAALGKTVPGFVSKAAELPLAGAQAGAEAAARQPFKLQEMLYGSALKQIEQEQGARLDVAKAAPIAAATAMAQLPAELVKIFGKSQAELIKDWDAPQQIKMVGADGVERTITTTPRQMAGGLEPGAAMSGGPAGPGAAATAPRPEGIVTGLGPQRTAELEARGKGLGADYAKINTDATTARSQIADLKTMQSNAQNLAAQGIFADNVQFANRVINGVTGQQADRVAAYELVTKNSEKLIRDATRQSDSQPAAIQLVMTRNSMPTPSTSVAGFDGVVGQMLGAQQYTVYKQQAAEQWLADPRHNNSLQGFENTLPVSPYAFMVNQMPDSQKAALAERLRAAGPAGAAEAQALAAQIRAAKAAGF